MQYACGYSAALACFVEQGAFWLQQLHAAVEVMRTLQRFGCTRVQGWYKEQHVAVKRCKIGKAADLLSFQQEVTLLSQMRHPGIVSLLAAKALPPGSTLSCMMTVEPLA